MAKIEEGDETAGVSLDDAGTAPQAPPAAPEGPPVMTVDSVPDAPMAPPEPTLPAVDSVPEVAPPAPADENAFPRLYNQEVGACKREPCDLTFKLWSGFRPLWQCPKCGYECWTPEEASKRLPGVQVAPET